MLKKTFIKIFFFIFLFLFIQNIIISNKAMAWFWVDESNTSGGAILSSTDKTKFSGEINNTGACPETTTTYGTIYVRDTADLTGFLPLCFYDTNSGDSLKLYKTDTNDESNRYPNQTTTYPAATSTTPNRVNVSTTFLSTQINNTTPIDKYFYITDGTGSSEASFRLTLKPAFRVKFLNPDPTDGVLTDEFTTLKKESDSSLVSVGSPYPIIVYEGSTSTKMAFGGFVKDPIIIIDNTTKKVWEFGGWKTNSSLNTDFNFDSTTFTGTLGQPVTIYAKWVWNKCEGGYQKNSAGDACEVIPPTATAYKVQFLTSQGNSYLENSNTIKVTVYQNSTSTKQALTATGRNPVIPSPSVVEITNGKWVFEAWCKDQSWTNCLANGTGDKNYNFDNTDFTNETTVNVDSENVIPIYAKYKLVCDNGYSSTDNSTCVQNPCGITSTSTATTNGTACPPLITSQINNTPTTTTISTNKNGALAYPQDNIIFNLKYGDTFKTTCSSTTRIDLLYADSNTNITGSNVSSPFTTSNSYDYDYGNTNSVYTILCQNIGGHTVSGNSVYTQFRTPKRWTFKFVNTDPTENFGNDNFLDKTDFNFKKWDGETVLEAYNREKETTGKDLKLADTSAYTFDYWYWNFSDPAGSKEWGDGISSSLFGINRVDSGWDNEGTVVFYAKWTPKNPSINPPSLPCVPNYSTTTTENVACPSPYMTSPNAAIKTSTSTCNAAGTKWTTSSSTNFSACKLTCDATISTGETFNYVVGGNPQCPTIPNISCGFKPTPPAPQNYQNYILSSSDANPYQCKDSSGTPVQTLFTYNNPNGGNYDILGDTASNTKLYSTLFANGFKVEEDYVKLEQKNYDKFYVSCPTIISNASLKGILKNISCQDIPAAKVQYFDVSNSQVASGSKINLFWTIKYPNTSCKIVGKHISDPSYVVLDTNKEFLYNEFKGFESDYRDVLINLVDNLTSTSTNGSYIKETSYKTKGKKVSGDLISSSFASSSLGSNLLTITKSTQFVASCYFDPTNSTSTIIKNVYVVGGGER